MTSINDDQKQGLLNNGSALEDPADLMNGGGEERFAVSTKRSRTNSKDNTGAAVADEQTTAAGEKEAKDASNQLTTSSGKEQTDAEKAGFSANMTILQCFWLVATIATPPIIGMLLYILIQLINTWFVGNMDEPILLAGVGMGNMLINVLAFALIQGLNGALETLVSKAYGDEDYVKCGELLNRGKFVVTCIMIPIAVIFGLSERILIAIKQEPAIAEIAKRYCCILLPGVWAQGLFDSTRKFCSAQFQTKIQLYVQVLTLILHFIWCWLFIKYFDLREVGAALATNITYILNMVIQDVWIYNDKDLRRSFHMPNSTMFHGVGEYLKIGIPGAMMLCFEWWCFELLAIFSGLMSVEALGAEIIVVNIVTFIFMVPLGCSYAASAFTGFFCASGQIDEAKKYSRLTILFNSIITLIILIVLASCQKRLASFFTGDQKTVDIVYDVMFVLYIYIFFDTIHGVQSGIIRGLGRQGVGSIYTLVCYWIIGLPLALFLAFRSRMGVKGLWLGFSIACIILDAGFAVIIECPEWPDGRKKGDGDGEGQNIGPPRTPEDRNLRRKIQQEKEKRQDNLPFFGDETAPTLGQGRE